MKLKTITASTFLPLDLEEVKDHLRIEHGRTEEDAYLTRLIKSAQNQVEEDTNRALTKRTLKVYFNEWPSNDDESFELPYAPLTTGTKPSITYRDTDSSSVTVSSTVFKCDAESVPGKVIVDYNEEWPTATLHNVNPISIQYLCGYEQSTAVPQRLKQALLVLIADMYENRESLVVAHSYDTLPVYRNLIKDYRDFEF